MKYFTSKWLNDPNMTAEESDAIVNSYWNSINDISHSFSAPVHELAFNTNLHDAIIFKMILHKAISYLEIHVVSGDLQVGYNEVCLKYYGVTIIQSMGNRLSSIFRDDVEILYDEIALEDNLYSHSLIFSNKKELEIVFKELEVSKKNKTTGTIKSTDRLFQVIEK
jgi:hypothetical protein